MVQPTRLLTGKITGLLNNDNITANYSCGATVVSPAGQYTITPSVVDPNGRLSNYLPEHQQRFPDRHDRDPHRNACKYQPGLWRRQSVLQRSDRRLEEWR